MASQQPGEAYEQQNVHEVYQEIAQHFSATRYKVCYKRLPPRNPAGSN